MTRKLVFKAQDVEGFTPAEADGGFVSRLLIDSDGVGSERLVMNHFTLRAGQRTAGDSIRRRTTRFTTCCGGGPSCELGDPVEKFDLEPNMVVFIPGGTYHALHNYTDWDVELLTVMPGPMQEGINSVYDGRRRAWGTAFKLEIVGRPGGVAAGRGRVRCCFACSATRMAVSR